MANMKKIVSLVIALTMVFSLAVCSNVASAKITDRDFKIGLDLGKLNPLKWFDKKGDKDKTPAPEAPETVAPEKEDSAEGTTEKKPFFYIDYDVVKEFEWGFSIGKKPEEKPAEPEVVAPETTEPETEELDDTTPLATVPETEVVEEVVVVDEAPKGEAIANTGDASIAAVVALTVVSAAAVVVAKKK